MSVVDQAIEDRVRECGVTDDIVPVVEGELAGDQRRPATIAVFEDFEEVAPFAITEGRSAI